MNRNELFQAIGDIDENFIMEAQNNMKKHFRFTKLMVGTVAAALLLGVTALATNIFGIIRETHSYLQAEFKQAPTNAQVSQALGREFQPMDTFSNGYAFQTGFTSDGENYSEDGKVVEQFKALNCSYTKEGDTINLLVDTAIAEETRDENDYAENYNESRLYYTSYVNKRVPGDYQMTEQDLKDQEAGTYVFSFGSAQVETAEVQILSWRANQLNYNIIAEDSALSKDELIDMAKELLDLQDAK